MVKFLRPTENFYFTNKWFMATPKVLMIQAFYFLPVAFPLTAVQKFRKLSDTSFNWYYFYVWSRYNIYLGTFFLLLCKTYCFTILSYLILFLSNVLREIMVYLKKSYYKTYKHVLFTFLFLLKRRKTVYLL